jgi:hypothetical protein
MDQSSDLYNYALSGICTDCMVLAAGATMANREGVSANIGSGVYTHHIIMTDIGRKQVPNPVAMDCGGFLIDGNAPMGKTSVFLGKGDEFDGKVFTPEGGAIKSGFYMKKADSINVLAEIVNYDTFDKDLYLRMEYEYLPGRPEGYLDIGMGAVHAANCNDPFQQMRKSLYGLS